MRKLSLDALAREQLAQARTATARRSASSVFGGHEQALRQTLVALLAGADLTEHENPGEATIHVLAGRITLTSADAAWEARDGDLLIVPSQRHAVHALEDSVILLTTVPFARTR